MEFRYRHEGSMIVMETTATEDDSWQPLVKFVESTEDGGLTAHPCPLLVETAGEHAAEVANRHLRAWQEATAAWGRQHPGELLPDRLRPQ